MYYEALRLSVESVLNVRTGVLRGRYLASDGTREWDFLWSGTIPDVDTDDPLDDVFYVLSVISEDLTTENGRHKGGQSPSPGGIQL